MKHHKEGQTTSDIRVSIVGESGFRQITRLTPDMQDQVPASFTIMKDGVPHILTQALAQIRLAHAMAPKSAETGTAWSRSITKSGIHKGPGRHSR